MSRFALAKIPTPILNIPHFKDVFGKEALPLDSSGLLCSLEMVALPGTKFEIVDEKDEGICEIKTSDYPSTPLFVDHRFLVPCATNIPDRKKTLPSKENILAHLKNSVGLPYIWGGNWGKGVPEILSFYRKDPIKDPKMYAQWILQGVDCSGLLYEATQGYTPRNTSALVHYGNAVLIENKTLASIQKNLLPLDLIVWKGHVIIVLNQNQVIESIHRDGGVVLTDLRTRLEQLAFQEKKIPLNTWTASTNQAFVIRRFVSQK